MSNNSKCYHCHTGMSRLYVRSVGARRFHPIGFYCNVCKWFLTDEVFKRGPRVQNQREGNCRYMSWTKGD